MGDKGVPLAAPIPDKARRRAILKLAIMFYSDATLASYRDWKFSTELAVTRVENLEGYIATRDMEREALGTKLRMVRLAR